MLPVSAMSIICCIVTGYSANAAFGTVDYVGGSLDSYSVYFSTASDDKYYLVIAQY